MTDEEQKKIFSRNLNKYIALNQKQQIDVAKDLDISPTTLNMWCKGNSMPGTGKIRKLADYFRIGMSDLTDEKETAKEDQEPAEDFQSWEHTGEQSATDDTENEEAADTDDSEKSSDKAAEVEIKDAEEEEDADEPENFEETMDAASESEE